MFTKFTASAVAIVVVLTHPAVFALEETVQGSSEVTGGLVVQSTGDLAVASTEIITIQAIEASMISLGVAGRQVVTISTAGVLVVASSIYLWTAREARRAYRLGNAEISIRAADGVVGTVGGSVNLLKLAILERQVLQRNGISQDSVTDAQVADLIRLHAARLALNQ